MIKLWQRSRAVNGSAGQVANGKAYVAARRSLKLSIWIIILALTMDFVLNSVGLMRESAQVAERSSSYINHIVEAIKNIYWRLILLFAFVSFLISYAIILRAGNKGIKQVEEMIYGCKCATIGFIMAGIIWLLMAYLSRFEQLAFLIREEIWTITPVFIFLILHIFYTSWVKRKVVFEKEKTVDNQMKAEIFNAAVKRSLIWFVWQTAFTLMTLLTVSIFLVTVDESIIADRSNIYIASIEKMINEFGWLILCYVFLTPYFMYTQMARWGKEGIQEAKYKEMVRSNMLFVTGLILIYMTWSLMYYMT